MPVERKIDVSVAPQGSDFKEFTIAKKGGSITACAPGACGGGPGGACQGACRGCREFTVTPKKSR